MELFAISNLLIAHSLYPIVRTCASWLLLIELRSVLLTSLIILWIAWHHHLLLSRCIVSKHEIVSTKYSISTGRVFMCFDLLVLRRDKVVWSCWMRSSSTSDLRLSTSNFHSMRLWLLTAVALCLYWTLAASDLPLLRLLLYASSGQSTCSNLICPWFRTATWSHWATSSKLIIIDLSERTHRSVWLCLRVWTQKAV